MNARITDEQLCAYLDEELDRSTRLAVRQALDDDRFLPLKLAGWAAQDMRLKVALDAQLQEPVPQAWQRLVRSSVASRAPAVHAKPLLARLAQWLPAPRFVVGMSFALMIGIVVGRDVLPRFGLDNQLVRLAAVAHLVYSPDKRQPVEVGSEDPTLTAWISKRLGTKVVAPHVSGYRFLGGRLLAGAEEPAAQFMYEHPSGSRLTIFVRTEGAAGKSAPPECDAHRGVSVCYWYADDVAYALAGDMPQGDLLALAQAAARPDNMTAR